MGGRGGGGGGRSNFLCPHTNCHEKCWGMGGLPEPPTRKRQTYMQRVRWVRTHPPPPPHGPKRSAWKEPKKNLRKKERQRWVFSSNLSTTRSRNSKMSECRFAVVFLGSIFLKTLKMHSQVRSLLKTLSYLRLFNIFYSNNTHTACDCCFYPPLMLQSSSK